MTLLKDISIVWSLIHTLVMFFLLFESKYDKKKTLTATLATMIPLCAVNITLAMFIPPDAFGTLLLLTLTLPSLIVFFILSKHKDGRFFFTFCLVDTTVLEILYISQIINFYTTPDTYLVMFLIRLVAYPVLEIMIVKKLRAVFASVQKHSPKIWWTFAVISALFYVLVTLMMNTPTSITERPEYLPAMVLMFILMPVIYVDIFHTLIQMQKMYETIERADILQLQVNNITQRAAEYSQANEKFRIERHNFRHKMQTIAGLVERHQYDALTELVMDYISAMQATQVKRYCSFTVLDAVFATYLQKAENIGANSTTMLDLGESLPANEAELAAVIANALENAINACDKMPEEERFIKVQTISEPCFMLQIQNSFNGEVEFDDNGIPVNRADEHGFGTRSIVAFCEKHNAFYEFKTEDNVFSLRLIFNS